jgi:hypothetical protein
MALSNQTVQKLSDVLTPEVVSYIMEDERWVDFMHEIVPDAIQDVLGDVDQDLMFELALCIMDKISFKVST